MRTWSLVLVVALAGCSAGRAAVALVQADTAIVSARQRGAADEAPYEMAMAQAYLIKAREEAHFSSYRESVELARGAADWADQAIIAMEQSGTASAASAPDAPGGVERAPEDSAPTPVEPPAPPTPPARDPWRQPDATPTPTGAPAPQAPSTPEADPATPPRVIVVPVEPEPEPAAPKVIVVPRGTSSPSDEDTDDDSDAPESSE